MDVGQVNPMAKEVHVHVFSFRMRGDKSLVMILVLTV